MSEREKPEPIYLTGGERLLIVLALGGYRQMWETVGEGRHGRWLAGLRKRQCLRIMEKMRARSGKAETEKDRAIRLALETLAVKVLSGASDRK